MTVLELLALLLLGNVGVALAAAAFLVAARLRGWRIGKLSWPFGHDGGACRRCTTTWVFVVKHLTPYDVTARGTKLAMFPLCERCWQELGDGEHRYPFYADLMMETIDAYRAQGDADEVARIQRAGTGIVAALRAGL